MLAQIEVAHAYQNGVWGVTRNLEKAVEWYRYGAEHGHSEACYQLGVLFTRGVPGVPQLQKDPYCTPSDTPRAWRRKLAWPDGACAAALASRRAPH